MFFVTLVLLVLFRFVFLSSFRSLITQGGRGRGRHGEEEEGEGEGQAFL